MKEKREFAVMFRNYLKENGYTLISLLISLSILIFITPLILILVNVTSEIKSNQSLSEFELKQLYFYIESELNLAEQIEVTQNALHLSKADGTIVSIELYQDLVRRRVNYTGHEILLMDVHLFNVISLSNHAFIIKSLRKDGRSYEKAYFFEHLSR